MEIVNRGIGGGVAPVPVEQVREQSAIDGTPDLAQQPQEAPAAPDTNQGGSDLARLQALARREQRLRRETQRLQTERAQLQSLQEQLAGVQRENAQLRNWAQRFYKEPVQVLNEAGVHGDVITQGLLNQPSREALAIQQLEAQIADLKAQNEAVNQKMTDAQSKQYEQAKVQIRNDAKLLIDGDAAFEAIKANGDEAVEAIVELIEQTYFSDGTLMSVKQAAEQVENFLIEEAMKFAQISKIKEKLVPVQPAPVPEQTAEVRTPPAQATTGGTTISNRSIPAPSAGPRMSEKERIARAIAAFQGVAGT